jgi:hypothetical protein
MNILLWVLQILLALYYAMGGFYQANVGKLPPAWLKILPKPAWIAIGALQILLALGLVLPGVIGTMPKLVPLSAVGLPLLTLLVYALTIKKFIFKAFIWVLAPALLCAFVAYGRFVLCPF